ncbi:NAD(+) synthase [Apibacter muscae]|uniref:NH(3)-dependent NAD(+) synthetase n=1 Tax=Apibacter muscae TaxID=2509004 RepID=A0A563DFT5_9FLAO|nr:NAD(+) synthase [Apibacter muscae]TWP28982.1 NAD(+) synthase [Apibacter muscae]
MKTQEVISYIIEWLNDYIKNSGMKGFVVGVSGGIDSAVVSTLVAATGKPVLLLEMPIHQPIEQVSRAREHMDFLKNKFSNVLTKRVDLTNSFDVLTEALEVDECNTNTNLSLANTRSRLRMTTLYYYAGLYNFLVCGTGNKIEDFGVGFFTKYGDGGVDISPIADLLKSQVFELAKEMGISQEIQKAKPTDGLWGDDRSDEDQLGATYPELEWAMSVHKNHVSSDFSGRQKEVFEIYERLNKAAQHKIKPIPICIIPKELM